MVFTIMIPAAYLHFVLALTETLEKRKKLLISVYLLFYFFLLVDATPFFIRDVEPVMNFNYWPMATPIMSAWLFFFVVCVSYSAFLLFKKYKTSSGVTKLQLKYVSIGTIIAFICGSLNFVPWYKIPLPPIANAFVPIYVILMGYAITRYRLMDIKALTRNITFYFIISVFAYVFFYLLIYIYKIVFGDPLAKGGYVLGLFIAPIFAVIIYNSSKSLSDFLNKHIFYSLYIYEQAIKKAQVELSHYAGFNHIADIIIDTIKATLQADDIAVLLYNRVDFEVIKKIGFDKSLSSLDYNLFSEYFRKEQGIITREELEQNIEDTKNTDYKKLLHSIENQIYKNNISLCISIKNNGNLLGIIVLGAKIYEGSYSKEDFELLETLSGYAKTSVNNALIYKKLEEKMANKKFSAA